MYAQRLSALAFAADKKSSHKIRYRKSLRVQLFAWAEKTVLGMVEFFLPDNISLLQAFQKKKYKSEINLHGDAFSLLFHCVRNRRKVSKNRRIVVFRVEAIWNNKIIQGKREVLRDDYKTRGDSGNERKLSVCQCGALPEAVGARLCGEGILYVWNGQCL